MLTEMVLLGCIAIRTGGYLEWDGLAGRFTNHPDANPLLKANYQNGWTLGTWPAFFTLFLPMNAQMTFSATGTSGRLQIMRANRKTATRFCLSRERMERFAGVLNLQTRCCVAAQQSVKFPGWPQSYI